MGSVRFVGSVTGTTTKKDKMMLTAKITSHKMSALKMNASCGPARYHTTPTPYSPSVPRRELPYQTVCTRPHVAAYRTPASSAIGSTHR
eukprot:2410452-Rhodomonas_salina.2